MSQQLQEMPSSNGHCYTQSSVMHFSNVPGEDGQPQIYQATSSTRLAPGGVCCHSYRLLCFYFLQIKESRKAVRDSHTGIHKMAVSHHIGKLMYHVRIT